MERQRFLHDRLHQKIHRLAFNGGVNVFNLVVAGKNHHPDIAALGLHPLGQLQAGYLEHLYVGEDGVHRVLLQIGDRVRAVLQRGGVEL